MTASELRRKFIEFFESKGHMPHASGPLIPYDVTGRLDESLLFNGAGMIQFKPYFRGSATPPSKRLSTAQKCVRTGDIESVGDLSHLTFFEMMGNFSFGDYFKIEAIAYSWEFLTAPEWLGLDPKRLAFTVFQDDDDAYNAWSVHLRSAGIDPTSRIFRLGEDTNYWPAGAFTNGPPGPCGPNSEMFYWTSKDVPPPGIGANAYSAEQYLEDEGKGLWLEIWNDVFIQSEWQGRLKNPDRPSEGYVKEGMPNLPFQSIDTGMGLERTSAVLSGYRSVYDIDVFQPILRMIESVSADGLRYGADDRRDTAMRIIADHIRTACFCIADGILPGNSGRGYVLRRLIRRAVLKGQRTLGFNDPFFHRVYKGVVSAMGDHYTELVDRQAIIVQTLESEETLFRRTVSNGVQLLEEALSKLGGAKVLDGATAFRLYDTYGFPLEVTQEVCEESGVSVDIEGYEQALLEAQERSRSVSGMDSVYGGVSLTFEFVVHQNDPIGPTPTHFLGYETVESPAQIVGILPARTDGGDLTGEVAVALNQTPFYAESGGQVSDIGGIVGKDFEFEVIDLIKQDGVYVHLCQPVGAEFVSLELLNDQQALNQRFLGAEVFARVDADRRVAITRNHTATHLLHAALRSVLGGHVSQAGSLVDPHHLRFDFTHSKAVSHDELREVEAIVNAQILEAQGVLTYDGVPLDAARAMGAMALFGEKYADFVRVVQIGVMPPDVPSFSRELCGGIHVRNTGQIGSLRILHEASAASGIRRITATTGLSVLALTDELNVKLKDAADKLKSTPADLLHAIDKLNESLREERKKVEKLLREGASQVAIEPITIGSVELVTQRVEGADPKEAVIVAERLSEGKSNRAVIVATVNDGKVQFVAKVGHEAVAAKVHAGNLVRELAQRVGGGGGGKPDFATAGGKDVSALDAALSAVPEVVKSMLG